MTDPADRLNELRAQVRAEREREARTGRRSTGGVETTGVDARRVPPAESRRSVVRRVARRVFVAALVLVLPFFVLLRTGTWLYGTGLLGTWSALAVGAVLTFLLLAVYFLVAARWLRGRFGVGAGVSAIAGEGSGGGRPGRRSTQGAAVLVVAYCLYGLVFLSGANAKTDAVRQEYRSLHPMLRLAVATLVLADGDLLVTDATRLSEDYAAMGLPPNERSLHLTQGDGYAHAVDLRTAGRSGVRNALTRVYFAGLGFRTLRHVGTADHLHVSLPVPDS